MRLDRMERLEQLLKDDAANPKGINFDLRTWASPFNYLTRRRIGEMNVGTPYPDEFAAAIPVSCETAGCGLGLAALSGIFKDEGLTYTFANGHLYPSFENETGYAAAKKFFELPDAAEFQPDPAYLLFDPAYFPFDLRAGAKAELEVARRVRLLMEKGSITTDDVNYDSRI